MSVWKGGVWASQKFPSGSGVWKGGVWASQRSATATQVLRNLLFGQGQQGVMYVPKPTVDGQQVLYQDSAGTTPVTADGQPVGYIKDLSGNGSHASQTTAAAKPLYRTDKTLHWLEFDGVDDTMRTANGVLNTEVVVFAVGAKPLSPQSALVALPHHPTIHTNPYFRFSIFRESSNPDFLSTRVNGVGTTHGSFPNDTSCLYLSSDENNIRINGVSAPNSVNPATLTYPSTVPLIIGANAEKAENLGGEFYGMIGRGVGSTENERAKMESYIAALSGVTL